MLVWIAVVDVRTFTISNRLNLAIALLAPLYLVVGRACRLWPDAAIRVGVGAGGLPAVRAALSIWT